MQIHNENKADCIRVKLLRRSIKKHEDELKLCNTLEITKYTNTSCGFHIWNEQQQLNKKIKELEALGYKYIEGWDD